MKTGILSVLFFLVLVFSAAPAAADTLTLPADLKAVEAEAFYGDTSIDSVILPEGVVSIGAKAFADSSLSEITLPSTVTAIAEDAFDSCSLKTVKAASGSYAYGWMRDRGWIAEYRALLVGEQRFIKFNNIADLDAGYSLSDKEQRNVGDVRNFTAELKNIAGLRGETIRVTQKINLSAFDVQSAITNTFADTRDQDTSIFFIATHGNSDGDGDLMMAFTGELRNRAQVEAYRDNRFLSFAALASWLKASVKGRVIVILESCGAGSSIYEDTPNSKGLVTQRNKLEKAAAEKFVQKAVSAFRKADPGVLLSPEAADEIAPNSTGDLRLPKFYVLAAAQHHEDSWGWETQEEESSFNFFTKWLIEGMGVKGDSPADTTGDNSLSLKELYTYVKKYDNYPFNYQGITYYQHVQAYPQDSTANLLKLK
jgi:hypothetical protein